MAFYPGSDTKFQRFKKAFQGVEEHGAQPMQIDGFKTAPWLLKTGLTPQEVGCGKIEMHTLAQDGALQSASFENMFGRLEGYAHAAAILSRCWQI